MKNFFEKLNKLFYGSYTPSSNPVPLPHPSKGPIENSKGSYVPPNNELPPPPPPVKTKVLSAFIEGVVKSLDSDEDAWNLEWPKNNDPRTCPYRANEISYKHSNTGAAFSIYYSESYADHDTDGYLLNICPYVNTTSDENRAIMEAMWRRFKREEDREEFERQEKTRSIVKHFEKLEKK